MSTCKVTPQQQEQPGTRPQQFSARLPSSLSFLSTSSLFSFLRPSQCQAVMMHLRSTNTRSVSLDLSWSKPTKRTHPSNKQSQNRKQKANRSQQPLGQRRRRRNRNRSRPSRSCSHRCLPLARGAKNMQGTSRTLCWRKHWILGQSRRLLAPMWRFFWLR